MRVVGQQLAPRVVYVCNSGSVVCKCVMLNIKYFCFSQPRTRSHRFAGQFSYEYMQIPYPFPTCSCTVVNSICKNNPLSSP